MLILRGGFDFKRRRPAIAAIVTLSAGLIGFALLAQPASAQETDLEDDLAKLEKTLAAAYETRLAYVITGERSIDDISEAGLSGLSRFVSTRTALEPGPPIGVDLSSDELSFFPLIYWPITPDAEIPETATLARLDAYMKKGGTVLFDTRNGVSLGFGRGGGQTPSERRLADILANLNIPPLEPVPSDHVLTKAFYILNDFPGRFKDSRLWVEALPVLDETVTRRPARSGDGVSSIMISGNDLAGAWALAPNGRPLLPTTPDDPRQRTLAFRTGVNIVMYTLTGNYKADQIHIPDLLERLGQ